MLGAQTHLSSKRQEAYSFDLVLLLSGWLGFSLTLIYESEGQTKYLSLPVITYRKQPYVEQIGDI